MNITQLQNVASDPTIENYLKARKEQNLLKNKKKNQSIPLWIGGLAGAGAGLTWAGNKFITPEDRAKLENLASLSSRMDPDKSGFMDAATSKDFSGSSQMFYDYVDRASQAAGAKIYGKPIREFIESARKGPLLRGTTFDMAKASPWSNMQTDDHYRDFEAGPLAAYVHQLQKHDEAVGSEWGGSRGAGRVYLDEKIDGPDAASATKAIEALDKVPGFTSLRKSVAQGVKSRIEKMPELERPRFPEINPDMSPKEIGSLLSYLKRRNSGEADTYHEFRKKLDSRMADFLQEEKVIGPEERGKDIREISENLPHGKEMDLLRKFRGWVGERDKDLDKMLNKVEPRMAEGMAGPARMYTMAGTLSTKILQDVPKILGAAALLTSAGLGGVWLFDRLRKKKKQQEFNQKKTLAANKLRQMQTLKTAASYPAYLNYNVQQMLPLAPRRELSPREMLEIAQNKKQWIPSLFEGLNASPSVNMASPARQSLLWGAGIGLPMALSSAANTGSATQGLGTGIVAGSLAAAIAYHLRRQKNEDIEETMRRLPEGANLRDFQADPLMAERRRMAHENRVRLNSNFRY